MSLSRSLGRYAYAVFMAIPAPRLLSTGRIMINTVLVSIAYATFVEGRSIAQFSDLNLRIWVLYLSSATTDIIMQILRIT